MAEQKRGRRIAMRPDELDAFLGAERTCRVGTNGPSGPHVTPLWFVWDGEALWLYSLTRSQRWADITRNPRVAVLVDAGHDYAELRGAELVGDAEVVGEAPRAGAPEPRLEEPERLFAAKYFDAAEFVHDQRHAWLRVEPETVRSWDFRKLAEL
ncbi:pyridoxamine 5'-phosphate oxidase family protein [Saccharopolyspora taberi]|uniref:Pyridoxamine 5'-phosphate oxidase family protein n=1 Tax=Saccharopolyspora taberi TaxID=60895 RepID=A0ABN3VL87_9PSEU